MRNKLVVLSIGLTMLLTGNSSMAGVITLYDGASQSVTPDQYNSPPKSLSFTTSTPGTQSYASGVTTLNTSPNNNTADNNIYAGYSNYNFGVNFSPPNPGPYPSGKVNTSFPVLDRNAGYDLSFTVKINSQINDGTNGLYRAGFSVIALSSDKKGIEIGFRPNTIAANSDIFSQDKSSFDTIGEKTTDSTLVSNLLSTLTAYNLKVSGENYTLTTGATTLLSGLLRDYTTAAGFGTDVYRTPNFLFLGDDTTSARANIALKSITLNTAPVPYEFSPTAGILALVAVGTINYLLKKKKS